MIKVSSILIGVTDLNKLKGFYEEILGMTFDEFRPLFASAKLGEVEFNIEEDASYRAKDWAKKYIGGRILFLIPVTLMSRMLGVVFLVLAVKDFFPSARLRMRPTTWILVSGEAVNGLLGGILGNAAIMRGQVLLALGLSKAEFVGTSTTIALPMNIGKSSAYVTQIEWSQDLIILFIAGIPLMLLGVRIGKQFLSYVSTHAFESCQRVIILIGAARFLLF